MGCFVQDGAEVLENCQRCTYPETWKVFHRALDLCFVDGGKDIECQEMCHLLQDTWSLTCSCQNGICMVSPVESRVSGDTLAIDGTVFDNGQMV